MAAARVAHAAVMQVLNSSIPGSEIEAGEVAEDGEVHHKTIKVHTQPRKLQELLEEVLLSQKRGGISSQPPYEADFSLVWPPCVTVDCASNVEVRLSVTVRSVSPPGSPCGNSSPTAQFSAKKQATGLVRLLSVRHDLVMKEEMLEIARGTTATRTRVCEHDSGVLSLVVADSEGQPTIEAIQRAAHVLVLPRKAREEVHRLLWRMTIEALPTSNGNGSNRSTASTAEPLDPSIFESPLELLPPKLQNRLAWAWSNHFRPLVADLHYLMDCAPGQPGGGSEEDYRPLLASVVQFFRDNEMWNCLAWLLRVCVHKGIPLLPNPGESEQARLAPDSAGCSPPGAAAAAAAVAAPAAASAPAPAAPCSRAGRAGGYGGGGIEPGGWRAPAPAAAPAADGGSLADAGSCQQRVCHSLQQAQADTGSSLARSSAAAAAAPAPLAVMRQAAKQGSQQLLQTVQSPSRLCALLCVAAAVAAVLAAAGAALDLSAWCQALLHLSALLPCLPALAGAAVAWYASGGAAAAAVEAPGGAGGGSPSGSRVVIASRLAVLLWDVLAAAGGSGVSAMEVGGITGAALLVLHLLLVPGFAQAPSVAVSTWCGLIELLAYPILASLAAPYGQQLLLAAVAAAAAAARLSFTWSSQHRK